MKWKRGVAYAAAIAAGAITGVVWGDDYFAPDVRGLIGGGLAWVAASLWFDSLDETARVIDAQKRQQAQFERDMKP